MLKLSVEKSSHETAMPPSVAERTGYVLHRALVVTVTHAQRVKYCSSHDRFIIATKCLGTILSWS